MDRSRKYPESEMCRQPLFHCYKCMDCSRKYPESGMCRQPLFHGYKCMDHSRKYPESGMCRQHFSTAISTWIVLGNTLNSEYVNRIVSCRTICGVFMTILGKAGLT